MWQLVVNSYIYLRHMRMVGKHLSKTGRFPNVAVPKKTEEKYLWRKVFDKNPLFTRISDKLLAKEYAARKCPHLLIPRVLWVGRDFNDIPKQLLTRPSVLKSNHASGHIIFLDGTSTDCAKLKNKTDKWLSKPFGGARGEWAYSKIDRKIFLEELVQGKNGKPFEEYNVYVMDERAQFSQCLRDSNGPQPKTCRFDRDGNQLGAQFSRNFTNEFFDAPEDYGRIIAVAEKLGTGFDHIRCDVYLVGNEIYFSEMTVYPIAGYPHVKGSIRKAWEDHWDLRSSWYLTTPQSGWKAAYANALRGRLESETNMVKDSF